MQRKHKTLNLMLKCYRNQSHSNINMPAFGQFYYVYDAVYHYLMCGVKTKKCAKVYGILRWLLVSYALLSKCHILLYSLKPIPICVICGKMTTPCMHICIGRQRQRQRWFRAVQPAANSKSSFINFIYIYTTSIFSYV